VSNPIDRDGIFQAVPKEWWVEEAQSGAVAIVFDFDLIAKLEDGGEWDDAWATYEPSYTVFGYYWVVKKDGTVNTGTVEQLAKSLGWDGNLDSVKGEPPNYLVQVSIQAEDYQGKRRYKAGWMNRGDHNPTRGTDEVKQGALQGRFGSLLAAAATGATQGGSSPLPEAPVTQESSQPAGAGMDPDATVHPDSTGNDSLPF
jgi:hypothetical protein